MKFYDRKFAVEYDRRLAAEGYPGRLLERVEHELGGARSVIDVGAGSGFFAIPLAARGFLIEAVEPSKYMLDILRGKLDETTAPRIRIHQTVWEEWSGEKCDALICLHSLYPIPDPRAAIEKMIKSAARRILLVRSDEGSRNLIGILREETGRARDPGIFVRLVEETLRELGVRYSTAIVEQRRTGVFHDLDGEARYYCGHLGLKHDQFEKIRTIIEEHAVRRGDRYEFEGIYRDVLLIF
jgi:SAM-dependent methyltransferase